MNDCDPKLSEFIIKPFKAEEFKKKINYLLGLQFQDKVLVLGDLKIDLLKQIVTIKEKIIALGKKERDILVMLARKTGQVVSHEKLLMVIGESSKNQAQLLNDHINEIRRKFKETSTNHLKISSFYGGGYRLDLRS